MLITNILSFRFVVVLSRTNYKFYTFLLFTTVSELTPFFETLIICVFSYISPFLLLSINCWKWQNICIDLHGVGCEIYIFKSLLTCIYRSCIFCEYLYLLLIIKSDFKKVLFLNDFMLCLYFYSYVHIVRTIDVDPVAFNINSRSVTYQPNDKSGLRQITFQWRYFRPAQSMMVYWLWNFCIV